MYVTIRSQMSSIMDLIGAELFELFALEFAKIAESDCLHSSIYKCRPMSTKHGHNIYDNEILDEFSYESDLTVTSGIIFPWIRKNCLIWLCLTFTLASTNNNQSVPNLVIMYGTVRSWKGLIMNVIWTELSELSAHYLKKLLHLTFFTFYHLHI